MNHNSAESLSQQDIKNFASWILSLTPFEFTTLATIIGYILSLSLTTAEQNSLGNWLELVGQIILTFNAQASANTPPTPSDYYNLVRKVQELENQIKRQNSKY